MLHVALDAGPLHGHRTGIGNAVAWYLAELDRARAANDLTVSRYVVSTRARTGPDERKLPVPAAVALRWWGRTDWPNVDRLLGRPDVVHGTNYVVPPTRAPRVVSVYDCWFLDHPESASPDVRRASRVLVRALRAGATALVSSEASARRLREHVETDRIEIVHLGPPVDDDGHLDQPVDERVAEFTRRGPTILSIGTLERRKNVPALVRAFGRVAHEHETAQLVIAGGDGDDTRSVDDAISALAPAAAGRVLRAGRVSAATKRWLLGGAAALAYPSLDEGFGFPVLEAQGAGIPIAASTAGSIPEIGGSGARYCAPDDVDALAANLFGLLGPSASRDALIEAGHRNLDRFSWADCVASTVALYRRVADDGIG